jgi:2-polyprenyl-3-methyl-5-hydroxy-6-metoxy-1,4-benzoquinol methylase
MDQPGLDKGVHRRALDGLRATNLASRVSRVIWRGLGEAGLLHGGGRPLRILDIAAGGGDVLIGVAKIAARNGVAIEPHGCDINATAIEHAQQAAAAAGIEQAKFHRLDALEDPLPTGYDVLMCSLFLHHLSDSQARELLRRMARSTGRCIFVDDLRRMWRGYVYAWLGSRLLTRSRVIHVDGPLSVRAAFTIEEVRALVRDAGLQGARFRQHWPGRFLMLWNKP